MFPRLSIALVQHESEVLHAPTHDVGTVLALSKRWHLTLYGEQGFEALLDPRTRHDCIVFGHNALHKNPGLVAALSEKCPATGICVLHQLSGKSLGFMDGDLRVGLGPDEIHAEHSVVAAALDPRDEVLLNWPEAVPLQSADGAHGAPPGASLPALAVRALEPARGAGWRTVLEIEEGGKRLPVLIRTPATRRPGLVVCSVLIEPHRPGHTELLTNMILWASTGRPDVAVLYDESEGAAAELVRKLYLQGVQAVSERVAGASFSRWPLRNIASVAVAGDGRLPQDAEAWFGRGGRIVRVSDDGRILTEQRARDAYWVAQLWAAWFQSEPAARWHGSAHGRARQPGSVFDTLAVLTMLDAARRGGVIDAGGDLGVGEASTGDQLPRLADFEAPVTDLLRRRLSGKPHIDRTVGVTAAALELDRLMGGRVLASIVVEGHPAGSLNAASAVRDWLRGRMNDELNPPSIEDRLDIAAGLGPGAEGEQAAKEAFRAVDALARRHGGAIPALLATRVRRTAVVCAVFPDEQMSDPWQVADTRDLDESCLLASQYLHALLRYRAERARRALPADPMIEPPHLLDSAVATIARRGSILRRRSPNEAGKAEAVSLEGLALLEYFDQRDRGVHVIHPEGQGIAPAVVDALLREIQQLRAENAELPGLRRTVSRARDALGVAVLLGAGVGIPLLIYAQRNDLTAWIGATTALCIAVLALAVLLGHLGLLAPWLERITSTLSEGWEGVTGALRSRLGRSPR
jgi:hypothetical protein